MKKRLRKKLVGKVDAIRRAAVESRPRQRAVNPLASQRAYIAKSLKEA